MELFQRNTIYPKSKVLTVTFPKSKIIANERRFHFDTENRTPENRESSYRRNFVHCNERRQSPDRGGKVTGQEPRTVTFDLGFSKNGRNGQENSKQKIKRADCSPWKVAQTAQVTPNQRRRINATINNRRTLLILITLRLMSSRDFRRAGGTYS